jgi:alpha-ketoglutarate-dependent taurine dioxygenase
MSGQPTRKAGSFPRRKAITISPDRLIRTEPLSSGGKLPLLVQPAAGSLDLVDWAAANLEFMETRLSSWGALLFRDFNLPVDDLEELIRVTSGEAVEYTYASTPRRRVSGRIYTSTEYPPDETIPLHNEMSYSRNWPMKIWFFCIQPAEQGGETPIADSRKVLDVMDPLITEEFARKGVMYVRNYRRGVDLSWQTVFQTSNRQEVEEYCKRARIKAEWGDRDSLKTRQVCQGIAAHPKSGANVWFNQAHLFHASSLDPEVRRQLVAEFGEDGLPRNTRFGDGTPIEEGTLKEVRDRYDQQTVVFSWKKGDVLMLDNMLTAHGRTPFKGPRRVLVGMAEPYSGTASPVK